MATITSAASGLASATSTWVGGVVPGTTYAGTRTTTGAAVAIGATSIPVTATGPVVTAGKWLKIGAEQYRVATGLAASTAGSIVIDAPGLLVAIPTSATSISVDMVDDQVIIAAGHVVTNDRPYSVIGNDASSTTATSNGIVVLGTLKASRAVSTTLVCRGTIALAAGGSIDFGTTADPIPSGITAALVLNDSASLAIGKHGFAYLPNSSTAGGISINGVAKKRNAKLTGSLSAGSASISVDDATGWAAGDIVVIQSDTNDPSRSQKTTLASGSGLNWTLGAAASVSNAVGAYVCNLSSNVIIKPYSNSFPTFFSMYAGDATTVRKLTTDVTNGARFEDIGCASWVTGGASAQYTGLSYSSHIDVSISGIASEWTHSLSTIGAGAMLAAQGLNFGLVTVSNTAAYSTGPSGWFASYGQGAQAILSSDVVAINTFGGVNSTNGGSIGGSTSASIWARSIAYQVSVGDLTANNALTKSSSTSGAISTVQGRLFVTGGSIDSTSRLISSAAYMQESAQLSGVTLLNAALTGDNTVNPVSKTSVAAITALAGAQADNRNWNYWRTCETDLTTTYRETFSVKIRPKVSGVAIIYQFRIPAIAGVAQTINPALQFDATYGAATPPIISLSGQGVADSWTCPATADQWFAHAFTFTPTSTGDITVTVTVQSTSTAGFVWLGGIYHYPMIQSVRQWGYQWLPQAAQLVDTRITLTEAAALALPVSVNHGTSTVTISGSVTPGEALQAMLADLVQPANQATPVHVTGDGSTFATTYTVAFAGSGAVTGPYTDATGLHVSVTSSTLDAGTLVQVWDVAASTELYIGTPSGALALPIVYPGADKTLRLRAMQCGATSASLFVEQLGTLTSAGASFLVTQSPDQVYAANALDGSTVTGITIDDTHLLIELTGAPVSVGGVMVILVPCPMIYAYETYWLSTIAGIRDEGRIIHAVDTANYLMTGFKLKNISGYPALLTNGWMRDSVTGETATLIDFSGDPIFSHPDAVVAYGQAAATPAEIWSHASRTLTGTTSADVRYVNGVQIIGSGVAGDTWGPA